MRKCFHFALLILTALLLGGCFGGTEEITLNEDGSGRISVDFTVARPALTLFGGEDAIRRKLETFLAPHPDLRLTELQVKREGDRDRFIATVVFDSASALVDLAPDDSKNPEMPRQIRALTGTFEVSTSLQTLELRRTILLGEALKVGPFAVSADRIGDGRLIHIVHLPQPALRSNATTTRNGGRTLMWNHTIADHLDQPLVIELKTALPMPRWVQGLLVLATTGFALFGLWIFRWKKNSTSEKT